MTKNGIILPRILSCSLILFAAVISAGAQTSAVSSFDEAVASYDFPFATNEVLMNETAIDSPIISASTGYDALKLGVRDGADATLEAGSEVDDRLSVFASTPSNSDTPDYDFPVKPAAKSSGLPVVKLAGLGWLSWLLIRRRKKHIHRT